MHGQSTVWLLGSEKNAGCTLAGDSATLVLAVLDAAAAPIRREDLVQRVLALAGGDGAQTRVVEDAVSLLVRSGELVDSGAPELRSEAHAREARAAIAGHVVLGVTGAIGSLAAPALADRLLAAGHELRVAMTRSARRFVTARAFEAITQRRAVTSVWAGSPEVPAPHVELARWADVMVVYPCTATTLARVAAGDCSEIVSAVATTTRAPVLLAPSMNPEMWRAPAVEENLQKVVDRGFFVAHPMHGIEVADAPAERARRMGAAAPVPNVLRCVSLLLARAAGEGPRLATRAEWELEHAKQDVDDAIDPDIARVLDEHGKARVLDVGTGLGAVARAAARRGHAVVATDFARTAIERAEAVAPDVPVTWVVDDATDSSLRGTFDLCIDRGCFGCVPAARRARYVERMAALVRAGGEWLLKVHRAPSPLRAHGFTREEAVAIGSPHFDPIEASESSLSYGNARDCPSWTLRLRRRGPP
jgi:3-polyprenyl-4-hydroxybenzoate decarboxylase/SAM-dependent methyltransferase